MFTVQTIFFFLHIIGVIAWLGGFLALWVLQVRFRREPDSAAQLALLRQSAFYSRAVVGGAAALTLIAGLVLANREDVSYSSAWIVWGIAGLIVSMGLNGTVMRATSEKLGRLLVGAPPDDPERVATQRRLDQLNWINLLILLSVVFAMVFKPGS
jgi:uncharacterized membrane protein